MPDLASIAQFGVAGLAVFLFYRLAANHIDHNSKVLGELTEAITSLKEFMQNHICK